MKFATVQNLFHIEHPEGLLNKVRGGKVRVQFGADGRAYRYSARSNYELAERLGLIPQTSVEEIAQAVIEALLENEEVTVADLSGAGDTIRWHWTNTHGNAESTVIEEIISKDAYDRPISHYRVVSRKDDPWSCGREAR